MSRTIFYNARLVDPASNYDGPGGVVGEDGLITASGRNFASMPSSGAGIDCQGHILAPGLIERGAMEPQTLALLGSRGWADVLDVDVISGASLVGSGGGVQASTCMRNTVSPAIIVSPLPSSPLQPSPVLRPASDRQP